MRKRKKSTQQRKFIPRPDRPKEARAKERERMAEALAAYQGPITKCPPGSRGTGRCRRQIERRRGRRGPPRIAVASCHSPARLPRLHVPIPRHPYEVGAIISQNFT